MQLNVMTKDNKQTSLEVTDRVFETDFNEALIHQVVTAYLAKARQGTSQQKTRSDVSGGGAKPWRQKGTGRARAGTSRSPLWRTGGVTFASRTRNYEQKVNKKMYRAAMRSILAELNRQERLVVVDEFTVSEAKTKALLAALNGMNIADALIITEAMDSNLYLASRNIPKVNAIDVAAIDPVALIGHEKVIITVPALKMLEELLA